MARVRKSDSLALSKYTLEYQRVLEGRAANGAESDRKKLAEYENRMKRTTTLYVGNLSFYTTEGQLMALFSRTGDVKKIIMGLNKQQNRTPCGFCFIEYYEREDAENCMRYINGTALDDRIIRTDWDSGFEEGRQYGLGKSGGQRRDEHRMDYDECREAPDQDKAGTSTHQDGNVGTQPWFEDHDKFEN